MKTALILLSALICYYAPAEAATPVSEAFDKLRGCVMADDAASCRVLLTPGSTTLFDRFASYKLMPCLPTNFTVESEKPGSTHTILTASMPASATTKSVIHLAYTNASDPKLDIPATLRMGMGERWEKKVTFAEQLYMMMKQNMGDKLTCDKIAPLVK